MESLLPLLLWGGLFFLMMRFGCGAHLFGHRQGDQARAGHGGHGSEHAHGCCGPAGAEKATARSAVPSIPYHSRANRPDSTNRPGDSR